MASMFLFYILQNYGFNQSCLLFEDSTIPNFRPLYLMVLVLLPIKLM